VIRNVRTEWTGGPSTENGSYGIYPVQTRNLLIEGSVAIGASDAGIYVGQSENIVVRNNRAEYNVAGIEIENSSYADVYDNVATNNTGGILVFNMPDLPVPGHSTRVYNNEISNNNTANFAPEGTAVASVPAGSGVVINSNDKVEVFENRIADNKTANVVISSYFSTGYYGNRETADAYDAYPETIYIYGNDFIGGGDAPAIDYVDAARVALFGEDGSLPDVLWDGFVNPEKADGRDSKPEFAICIQNGDAGILNVDGPNEFAAPSTDMAPHDCSHPKLAPVNLEGGLAGTTGGAY
jgi:parallel beta-helix repeat protein